MTEHEYNRMCEKQEKQIEHRREVCADCEHCKKIDSPEGEFCTCDNGTDEIQFINTLTYDAEDGFCDAGGEDSDNAPTLTPKADEEFFKRMHKAYKQAQEAEVARNVAKVKGFCVKDINKYVACVNSFCERVIRVADHWGFCDKDITRGFKNSAEALIEMSKGGENGSIQEEH